MERYRVEPRSRIQLRELAKEVRKRLGLSDVLYFPIVQLLDVMAEIFPTFSYEIQEDSAFKEGVHAETDIVTGHVRIRETVYERACAGEGRDRMTIAHEIAHFIMLNYLGFKLQRSYKNQPIPAFEDPEWQAKCLAGEMMVPYDLVSNMQPIDVAQRCGVSLDAAIYQLARYPKGRRNKQKL